MNNTTAPSWYDVEGSQLSSVHFIGSVFPFLQKNCPIFKGSQLVQVENDGSDLANVIDRGCGIDYLILNHHGLTYPISSRIQYDCNQVRRYTTFTIRASRQTSSLTEYDHLSAALDADSLRPRYTVQAYLSNPDDGVVKRIAVARTDNLIRFIQARLASGELDAIQTTCHTSGKRQSFYALEWSELIAAKMPLWTYAYGSPMVHNQQPECEGVKR